ncbi:MAG TPA: SRPBCC family protein [Usitatibacter sp.]|nr:SRPBCC family protein [Usitatibacter sp.]
MSRLLFLGVGAALMFFTDPQAGRKRRTDFKNQLDATQRKLQQAKEVVVKDATNRTHGMLLESREWLQERRGKIQSGEYLPRGAVSLPVIAQNIAAPWMRTHWSPSQRALAGAFGASLAMWGYLRGGLKGIAMCAAGGALVARATGNEELSTLAKGRGIQVEKTVRIDAPVEKVFAYWRNLENLPQWMSHVREVRYLGGDRYHWVVDGPAGMPVEWDSELLNVSENREMTWRSVEGSQVENTGRVRFQADGDGTRVHVQMKYSPPGGIIGHAVAKAFGVDPKTEMDDDLERMKTTVETGKPPQDAAAMRRTGANGSNGATPLQ